LKEEKVLEEELKYLFNQTSNVNRPFLTKIDCSVDMLEFSRFSNIFSSLSCSFDFNYISIWDYTGSQSSNEIEWHRSYARRVGWELYVCLQGGISFELVRGFELLAGTLLRGDALCVPKAVWSRFKREGSAIVVSNLDFREQLFHTDYAKFLHNSRRSLIK
jgi:hypothetical protein